MPTSRSSFPWAIIFFLILLVMVVIAVFVVPRWWVEFQISKLPPEVRATIERFRSEPVEIPEDWVTPPEAPEDLLALVEKRRAILETQPPAIPRELQSRAVAGDELSDSEWEEVASILSKVDPQFQAIDDLVSHPSYWFGILPTKVDNRGIPDLLPIQTTGQYLPLRALYQARQGDYEGGIESLLTLLRLSIRHPTDGEIEQLVALALTQRAIQPMATLAKECEDPTLLKATLNRLNDLAPTIQLNVFDDPILACVVVWINYERKNGGALEVSPGKTGLDYLYEISAPNSAVSRMRRKLVNQPTSGWFRSVVVHFWSILTGSYRLMIAMSLPNQLDMGIRNDHIGSAFDLVRLALANRIHELQTGAKANDQNAFIPDLLKEPLLDPFTEKPYLWDASSEVFYSVAPDEVDDGNHIQYSPTNGSRSVGDFSLR